jgi:hypothetical protein
MSGRLKRGNPPPRTIRRHNYYEVLPDLLACFGERCAYSMQHQERAGRLEVDHFNPTTKRKPKQDYNNLFPASRHCNSKKSNHWPNEEQLAAGIRFLNPCEENDYGEQIFEDPESHLLHGTTPAATWHIRICGLNAEHLVIERKKRAECWLLFEKTKRATIAKGLGWAQLAKLIESYKTMIEILIPPIPFRKKPPVDPQPSSPSTSAPVRRGRRG